MKYYTKEFVEEAVTKSDSIRETLLNMKMNGTGSNYNTIRRLITLFQIDTSHFGKWRKTCRLKSIPKNRYNQFDEVKKFFVSGSTHSSGTVLNTQRLKEFLFRFKVKAKKCEECGHTHWMGKEIKFELHHVNGQRIDNRLENLQILCPMCHSFTPNFRRSKSSLIVVNKKDSVRNIRLISKPINVSDKPIKICEHCGNDFRLRRYDQVNRFCSTKCMYKFRDTETKLKYNRNTLIEDFKLLKSFVKVGKKYGVSDNAIRKICKKLNINIKNGILI